MDLSQTIDNIYIYICIQTIDSSQQFILNYSNNQVFLNHDFIKENIDVPMKDIQEIWGSL